MEPRKPMEHELKTWPVPFNDTIAGRKPFEYRRDDRDFQVGDTLRLKEWVPTLEQYTGRETSVLVTYLMKSGGFGIPPGFVIMGVQPLTSGTRFVRARQIMGQALSEDMDLRRCHVSRLSSLLHENSVWSAPSCDLMAERILEIIFSPE